jgi:CheY-like chemotaxis protein
MFGWTSGHFISGAVPFSSVIHPDDLPRVAEEVARSSADPTASTVAYSPYRIVARDDRALLEQVLFNLCNNSAQATPGGGRLIIKTANVMISESYVKTYPWARKGPHVVLSVIDEGIGMDEDTRRRVLDPFFTTKESGKGTGLGLTSAYGTIKQHQGWIDIQSELGVGTTVSAYLPVVEEPGAGTADRASPKDARSCGGEALLLVEDNPDLRTVLTVLLDSEGYRVHAAGDGLEALEILGREQEVAMVITDISMPRMGGAELYRRSRELLPDLRFIFCSGNLHDWEQLGCADDTSVSYLEKPFPWLRRVGS